MHQRIARPQTDQLLVHLQAVFKSAAARVVVAEDLQRIDITRVAADHAFQEPDFDVQVAFLFARHFFRSFGRHETGGMIAQGALKSRGWPRSAAIPGCRFGGIRGASSRKSSQLPRGAPVGDVEEAEKVCVPDPPHDFGGYVAGKLI